jgi:hypothetical protein
MWYEKRDELPARGMRSEVWILPLSTNCGNHRLVLLQRRIVEGGNAEEGGLGGHRSNESKVAKWEGGWGMKSVRGGDQRLVECVEWEVEGTMEGKKKRTGTMKKEMTSDERDDGPQQCRVKITGGKRDNGPQQHQRDNRWQEGQWPTTTPSTSDERDDGPQQHLNGPWREKRNW